MGFHLYCVLASFVVMLVFSVQATAQGIIAITDPSNGAVVTRGATLHVKFNASPDVTNLLLVSNVNSVGIQVRPAGGEFSLVVPGSTSTGKYTLRIMGASHGQVIGSQVIEIHVEADSSIRSVKTSPSSLLFRDIGAVLPLHVIATLADASQVDITHSTKVVYESSDIAVATVNESGLVTSTGPGTSFISIKLPTMSYSVAATVKELPVNVPVFAPLPGTFTSPVVVRLSSSSVGANVFYTQAPSTPLSQWTAYSAPITISSTGNLRAYAKVGSSRTSQIASGKYTIQSQAAPPVFSPTGGTYSAPQSIRITSATANAAIYYTLDGTSPSSSANLYTAPVSISATSALRAIATASGYAPSIETRGDYLINSVPADFSMTLAASTLSLRGIQSGSIPISVESLGGFSTPISFSCSGLPVGSACSFSPSVLTPSSRASTVVLEISTGRLAASDRNISIYLGTTLGIFLFALSGAARAKLKSPLYFILFMSIVPFAFVGCGSGFPKSTSQVTVMGTSGAIRHTSVLTLELNQ